MKLNREVLLEAYHATFINRNITYQKADIVETSISFKIQSVVYLLIVLLKRSLSPLGKRSQGNETVFVSWNPLHRKLASKIGQEKNVIDIEYRFNRVQVGLYQRSSFWFALIHAWQVFKARPERERLGYDNIFFCIAFIMEFQMINHLVRNSSHIYMAGQADRYAIMLSIISRQDNKYFSFVQHGVNNVFEGLYKLHANEIYYLFEISIPFFSSFVHNAQACRFSPIPLVAPDFRPDHRYKNAIAFASQIVPSDLLILDVIVRYYKDDILIYPHPTEKSLHRYKKYRQHNNVHITMDRISNIEYLISSGSTLGLEYDLIGVPPVFVNANNLNSEVFHSEKFIRFSDINSFDEWFAKEFAGS